jgi:hypothetical protein
MNTLERASLLKKANQRASDGLETTPGDGRISFNELPGRPAFCVD